MRKAISKMLGVQTIDGKLGMRCSSVRTLPEQNPQTTRRRPQHVFHGGIIGDVCSVGSYLTHALTVSFFYQELQTSIYTIKHESCRFVSHQKSQLHETLPQGVI